jgi:cobaltochelatase CobS
MSSHKISELFGVNAPGNAVVNVPAWDATLGAARETVDPNYGFQLSQLKKQLMVIASPQPPTRNVMMVGPSGCGKSSSILQVAARMNKPVWQIACSGKTRVEHMLGARDLLNGNTVWTDGPLLKAMRHGGIFLADEITRLHPDEQMGLAPLLDGGARITVKETGEVVEAHPGFRFFGTGNSNGTGDENGQYSGEKQASAAFTDRFMILECGYLDADAERRVIVANVPSMESHVDAMVRLANDIRSSSVSQAGGMRTIFSTRSLVMWAKLARAYQGMFEHNLLEALNDAILNASPAEEKSSILKIWTDFMGAGTTARAKVA